LPVRRGTLTVTARPQPLPAWDWSTAVQLAGEIAVIDTENDCVRYVGGETFEETRRPWPCSSRLPGLWASPDGRPHAVGGHQYRDNVHGFVEASWGGAPSPVQELAERPRAGWTLPTWPWSGAPCSIPRPWPRPGRSSNCCGTAWSTSSEPGWSSARTGPSRPATT
jgi:hypothetical protein